MTRLTRFAVAGLNGRDDGGSPVEIRCTRCGERADLGLHPDDVPLLSDLNEWARLHQCPPLAVT